MIDALKLSNQKEIPEGCNIECRGCSHRTFTEEESLSQKMRFIKSKLNKWDSLIEPINSVKDDNRWHYRSKTVLNTHWNGLSWVFGMIVKDHLISIPDCPIHTSSVNDTAKIIRSVLPNHDKFPLAFFLQVNTQVVLVVKGNKTVDTSWFTEDVRIKLQQVGIEGFWVHHNPSAGRRLFEKTPLILLFGKEKSVDREGFFYSIGAFQQLIPELYNKSLDITEDFFNLSNDISVVDLYCGIGKSIKRWLNHSSAVLGVEQNGRAVECANLNVPNAEILRGACHQRLPQIDDWIKNQKALGRKVVMYMNPPRTGIDEVVLNRIAQNKCIEKIAYLSCSPGTLSKNLDFLCKHGYNVKKILPYDFFPQTIHVECLALIEL